MDSGVYSEAKLAQCQWLLIRTLPELQTGQSWLPG